MFGLVKGNI